MDDGDLSAGESGNGTSALVQIVQDTDGAIGYADASRAGDLGTVALKVGEEYVPFSAEAAAAVVDASPLAEGANGENDLAYELDRTTTASGACPLVLVSYHILCQQYDDEAERDLVTSFLKYVASAEVATNPSPVTSRTLLKMCTVPCSSFAVASSPVSVNPPLSSRSATVTVTPKRRTVSSEYVT